MALLDEISCSVFHVETRYFEVTLIKFILLYCHMWLFIVTCHSLLSHVPLYCHVSLFIVTCHSFTQVMHQVQ